MRNINHGRYGNCIKKQMQIPEVEKIHWMSLAINWIL